MDSLNVLLLNVLQGPSRTIAAPKITFKPNLLAAHIIKYCSLTIKSSDSVVFVITIQ